MQATVDRSGTRGLWSPPLLSSPPLSSFLIPLSGRQSLPLRSPPVCTRLVIKPMAMPMAVPPPSVPVLLSRHGSRNGPRNVFECIARKIFANARGKTRATSHEPVTRETKSMNRIVDNYRARPFAVEGQKPLLFDPHGTRDTFPKQIRFTVGLVDRRATSIDRSARIETRFFFRVARHHLLLAASRIDSKKRQNSSKRKNGFSGIRWQRRFPCFGHSDNGRARADSIRFDSIGGCVPSRGRT